MAEELGKVEKPSVEEFKKGRKLFFVPLIFSSKDAPADFVEKFNRYWDQAESQLNELELRLGKVCHIYHELVVAGGDEGFKIIKDLNEKTCAVVERRLNKGGNLEATEDDDLLAQVMDCQRCISIGLQSQKMLNLVYESYSEAIKKRNEHIARQIDTTLGENEIGLLLMAEKHQVTFPADIQLFYVAPPALDEINRWLRDRRAAPQKEDKTEKPEKPEEPSKKEQSSP